MRSKRCEWRQIGPAKRPKMPKRALDQHGRHGVGGPVDQQPFQIDSNAKYRSSGVEGDQLSRRTLL